MKIFEFLKEMFSDNTDRISSKRIMSFILLVFILLISLLAMFYSINHAQFELVFTWLAGVFCSLMGFSSIDGFKGNKK